MNCEDLITYLSDYIDNELDEALSEAAREHLSTCKNCNVVLDSTRRTIKLYRQHQQPNLVESRQRMLFIEIADAFENRNL